MIMKFLDNIFLKHPRDHKVTYWYHCIISLNCAMSFFLTSIKAFIHSLVPCLFITSSSDCIKEMKHFIDTCYNDE